MDRSVFDKWGYYWIKHCSHFSNDIISGFVALLQIETSQFNPAIITNYFAKTSVNNRSAPNSENNFFSYFPYKNIKISPFLQESTIFPKIALVQH